MSHTQLFVEDLDKVQELNLRTHNPFSFLIFFYNKEESKHQTALVYYFIGLFVLMFMMLTLIVWLRLLYMNP